MRLDRETPWDAITAGVWGFVLGAILALMLCACGGGGTPAPELEHALACDGVGDHDICPQPPGTTIPHSPEYHP